jgi:autotransporter-associated beta strand protein
MIEFDNVFAGNPLIVNDGTLLTPNGWGATLSGPVMLNSNLNCVTPYTLVLSGAVSGPGGILKSRDGHLVLSGPISYSGNTIFNGGILQMNSRNTGNDGNTLTIAATGATVDLNFSGTEIVSKLYVGTTQMAAGICKPVGSSAVGMELAKLTGTGTVTVAPGATSTTVASSPNPAVLGSPVTFTASVTGNSPAGNVTFYAGATSLGTSALNGSFQAIFTTNSLAAGSYAITASYAGNATNTASTSAAITQVVTAESYSSWSVNPAQSLTPGVNNAPLQDPDQDGITNLMEFTLGGRPMASDRSILPTLTKQVSTWKFAYDRSDASLSPTTIQVVEHGNDLTGWTAVLISGNVAGSVTITPGSPSDRVSVVIPNVGPKTFVRLKVSQ